MEPLTERGRFYEFTDTFVWKNVSISPVLDYCIILRLVKSQICFKALQDLKQRGIRLSLTLEMDICFLRMFQE